MSWSQLTFVVDAAAVDQVSAALELCDAQAVTTANAGEDEFYEAAFPGTPNWRKVSVTGLFDAALEMDPVIEFVRGQLNAYKSADGDIEIPTSLETLIEQDWERVWLSSFKPIKVGSRLWVCPSWCDPVQPQERNIILDPGLAFGTGTHATTAMCLKWLADQKLSGKRVLDYGSGSGILAIAALMSDAAAADAVDIDPQAVTSCRDNAARNHLDDKMKACLPEELKPGVYDLVIANILAEVIIELRDTLLLHLRPDGVLLLTGILSSQADRVIDTFGEQFQFKTTTRNQWCLLICRRSPQSK
ncbi:MAG: 50S ribosomal protein L11 methyltransferase [Gammaproteobacteria bacterium]|nr:50S ribosomal protein L11 methyltransferase [Gammaproteobacteria bacterium]